MKNVKNVVVILLGVACFALGLYLVKIGQVKYSILAFTIAGVCVVTSIISLSCNSSPNKSYNSRINSILRTYDSILVKNTEMPNINKRNVITVSNFEDLINAQVELRKPICYLREEETCSFILLDEKEAWIYIERQNENSVSPLDVILANLKKQDSKNENSIDSQILEDLDKTTIIKLPNNKSFKVSPVRQNKNVAINKDETIKIENQVIQENQDKQNSQDKIVSQIQQENQNKQENKIQQENQIKLEEKKEPVAQVKEENVKQEPLKQEMAQNITPNPQDIQIEAVTKQEENLKQVESKKEEQLHQTMFLNKDILSNELNNQLKPLTDNNELPKENFASEIKEEPKMPREQIVEEDNSQISLPKRITEIPAQVFLNTLKPDKESIEVNLHSPYQIELNNMLEKYQDNLTISHDLPYFNGKIIHTVNSLAELNYLSKENNKVIYYIKDEGSCSFYFFTKGNAYTYIFKEDENSKTEIEKLIEEERLAQMEKSTTEDIPILKDNASLSKLEKELLSE